MGNFLANNEESNRVTKRLQKQEKNLRITVTGDHTKLEVLKRLLPDFDFSSILISKEIMLETVQNLKIRLPTTIIEM